MAKRQFSSEVYLALLAVFLGATVVLLRFTFLGPFRLILPVQSPLNAESIIGVSFLLLLLLRLPNELGHAGAKAGDSKVVPIILLAFITILPFLITINAPLLHDSYTHVAEAASESRNKVLAFFTHPSGSDLFFRPLGYFAYWLDFKWAGYDPVRWHICNLALHVANSCLVYAFASQLSLKRFSSLIAGLVFAVHGSRPEAVSWAAAQFDLLAAFFVLLSLVAFNQFLETRRSLWRVSMVCCAVLAVLSKEAAYCLPVLVLGLLPFQARDRRKEIFRAAGVLLAVCGVVLAYRSYLIGGIGGYRTSTGRSAILQLDLIRTIKGLFFRQWSFLFFPINWSAHLSTWVKISVIIMPVVMLGFLVWSSAKRHLVFGAILLVFIADLPVQHLLLLGAGLTGARVLYLPVLGLALFWGVLVQGCNQRHIQVSLTAGLLLFQFIALFHNLTIWRQTAFLSQKTCRALGAELARDPRSIVVRDLPNTWHGVFFLGNGFLPCVEINSHQETSRVFIDRQPTLGPARVFSWSDAKEQLEEGPPLPRAR